MREKILCKPCKRHRPSDSPKNLSCVVLLFLFLFPCLSFSQWEPDFRLTYDPALSLTCFTNARCVAVSGDTVHVVWMDMRDGDYEIYYNRSIDAGITWQADTRLTDTTGWSLRPGVAVSGSIVHVIWYDERDGNTEIYYKRSTDGGTTWEHDVRLTDDPAVSKFPSIAVWNDNVHVAWWDGRDGNINLYYKRSTNNGTSWETDFQLTDCPADEYHPCIAVLDSNIHVAWVDQRDDYPDDEIYYKRSTDNGTTWSDDLRLTYADHPSQLPCIGLVDSFVHVVWYDYRDFHDDEVYYKRSTDGGLTWGPDTALTSTTAASCLPSIAVSGSNLHVVWYDYRDMNCEIYYKFSSDAGLSWQTDIRLTDASGDGQNACIALAGDCLHVIWYDDRDGNDEIYYKRNPTGNPGIAEHPSDATAAIFLEISPNPFRHRTNIRYTIHDTGYRIPEAVDSRQKSVVSMKIYNTTGRLVKSFPVPSSYSLVPSVISWDGRDDQNRMLPSGVYFVKFQAGDYTETQKLLFLR